MLRQFLIFSSSAQVALDGLIQRAQSATGLRHAIQQQGLAILARSIEDVLTIPGGGGYILGTLFEKYGPASRIAPDDPQWLEPLAQPDPIVPLRDRFWGGYVALLADGRGLTMMRDPSGAMPCYIIPVSGGWAAASDVSLFVSAGLLKPTIAWDEIPRYLAAKDLPATRTAIQDVREILPGTYERLTEGRSSVTSFWSPWDHISPVERPSAAAMEERLKRTVDHCVASWASTTGAVLLTLSGGLDSSIVASALGTSKRPFSCVTISTGDGLGNERDYAHPMASAVGASLIEAHYDLADIDLSVSSARHFPKPIGLIHETAFHAAAMRVAGVAEADAIYTGSGGDNVFYNSNSLRPLLDCIRARGLGADALRTLHDIAGKLEISAWTVLCQAVRQYRQLKRPYAWQYNLQFMTRDARQDIMSRPLSHPWLEAQDGARAGKVGHVAFLLRIQNHIEGYLRAFDMPLINPLISQPIVELALAIPGWHMVEGGRDRAVARKAYHDALPPIIRDRRRKGSPSSFAIALLRSKRKEVRDRLMDGELVARGMVDADTLAAALVSDSGLELSYMRLSAMLDMEAWIEHWRG